MGRGDLAQDVWKVLPLGFAQDWLSPTCRFCLGHSHSPDGFSFLFQSVSCPELLDQHYTVDMTEAEHSVQHPVTKTATRRIVHAGTQPGTGDPSAGHHSLALCPELAPYATILSSIADSKPNSVRQRPIAFDNATHYYLYNRLMDFLTSREIVNRQIHDIVQSCQPGEVVIRDTLYRLGVAQIKTETEEEGDDEEAATVAE